LPVEPPVGQPPSEAEAEVIDPGAQVVDLGPVEDPSELATLQAEIDAVPVGAQAGLGGASRRIGPSAGWEAAGGLVLAVAGVALLVLWRRRNAT
jgi:hypothetical protein